MKKNKGKDPAKNKAMPPPQFETPTREEKIAYLDFCINHGLPPEEIPPGDDEEAAEQLIADDRRMLEAMGFNNLTNVNNIKDLVELIVSFQKMPTSAGADPRNPDEIVTLDFAQVTLTDKRRFIEALEGTPWHRRLLWNQDDEATLDNFIKMFTMHARMFKRFPRSLDDLAAFVRWLGNFEKHVPEELRIRIKDGLLRPLSDAFKDLPKNEKVKVVLGAMTEAIEATSVPWLKNQDENWADLDNKLKETNNSREATALFGSAIKESVKELAVDFVRKSEQEILKALDAKLDEIHGQLGELLTRLDNVERGRDAFAHEMDSRPDSPKLQQMPPMPVIDKASPSKKEYTVDRERIVSTVDRELFNLFHQERRDLGVSVSRLQDIILWQRYGMPKLSFQIEADEAPSSKSPGAGAQEKRKRGRPRKNPT